MDVLTHTTHRQLLTLLETLTLFDTRAGRDQLLLGLPRDLVGSIKRSEARTPDLNQIIHKCNIWRPRTGPVTDYPLRTLVQNALHLADGSRIAPNLQAMLDSLPTVLEALPREPCPYPGMVPFSAADARCFYGREEEIAAMAQRLRRHSFLLVIGLSGCGKSSLVAAGLVPQLQLCDPDYWQVISLSPGPYPATRLLSLLPRCPPPGQLLLVIDQLEEIFTQASDAERERFIDLINELRLSKTVQPARCAIVLTMRVFFLQALMESRLWPISARERFELNPLKGAALRAAIIRPAEHIGVYVEPRLVAQLIADAADEPGSLPPLQETLVLLWGRMEARTLTLREYHALGGDGRSGLAVVLANKANAVLATLTPAQQTIARRIFLRLITFGEGRPDTRRQQPAAALQAAEDDTALFTQTLHVLADNRLVTLSGEEAEWENMVDLSHERLIEIWPTLREWIIAWRVAEQIRRGLEAQAAAWERRKRQGGLLDEQELAEAEAWLAGREAKELGYSDTLAALVKESRAALDHRLHENRIANRRGKLTLGALALAVSGLVILLWLLAELDISRQSAIATQTAGAASSAATRTVETEENAATKTAVVSDSVATVTAIVANITATAVRQQTALASATADPNFPTRGLTVTAEAVAAQQTLTAVLGEATATIAAIATTIPASPPSQAPVSIPPHPGAGSDPPPTRVVDPSPTISPPKVVPTATDQPILTTMPTDTPTLTPSVTPATVGPTNTATAMITQTISVTPDRGIFSIPTVTATASVTTIPPENSPTSTLTPIPHETVQTSSATPTRPVPTPTLYYPPGSTPTVTPDEGARPEVPTLTPTPVPASATVPPLTVGPNVPVVQSVTPVPLQPTATAEPPPPPTATPMPPVTPSPVLSPDP